MLVDIEDEDKGNMQMIARQNDKKNKEKGKEYGDTKRRANDHDIQPGDEVLLQQKASNKLSTTFEHEPYVVTERKGSQVTIRSKDGAEYKRNVAHVKRYHRPSWQEADAKEIDSD